MKVSWKRSLMMSLVLIALGVTLMNMNDTTKTIGTVFIALGGLFLIVSFRRKQIEEKKDN
jgi:drug/metabolite transporter superfamily protein YnfA